MIGDNGIHEKPQSLAEYLRWCEQVDARLSCDQHEIAVLRRQLRDRMLEVRLSLTEEDGREYDALPAMERAG